MELEHQSLAHVLNSCQKALNLGRYTTRHDEVLKDVIHDFVGNHLASGFKMTVDLPGHVYSFPQTIALILTSGLASSCGVPLPLSSLSLQCPLKPCNISRAVERKMDRYRELREACSHSHQASIVTLEVGSHGFVATDSFHQLYKILKVKAREKRVFECEVIKHTIVCSYNIWCKRNWTG